MRKAVITVAGIVLFLTGSVSLFAQRLPEWVREYGMKTPYPEREYITGFGSSEVEGDEFEALKSAKNRALDDLIRKIRVQVKSSITTETVEDDSGAANSLSIVSQSVSDLKLTQMDFLTAEDRRNRYALAYTSLDTLKNYYLDNGRDTLRKIITEKERAEALEKRTSAAALDRYIKILPLFPAVLENRSVYNVLSSRSGGNKFFSDAGIGGVGSPDSFFRMEQEIRSKIDDLQRDSVRNLDAALEKIVVMLSTQGVSGGSAMVPPLLYQNSDFTSSFGNYASRKMESLIQRRLTGGRDKIVCRGTYWENGSSVEIFVVVQSAASGEKLGSAFAEFPAESIPSQYDLKPQNVEEALQAQYAIADGAFVDGGLQVEVWTNRGRNDDVLVFQSGESLELFFKVNQPAFLQITYELATGQKVLLEESFYIGMDMVNRVVRYPYEFEVVSPFGVERMMVSAFSQQPPSPNVFVDYIDGERYEVFGSTKAVVAQTRGLRKKQESSGDTEVKVGEAFLTMTTLPKE